MVCNFLIFFKIITSNLEAHEYFSKYSKRIHKEKYTIY